MSMSTDSDAAPSPSRKCGPANNRGIHEHGCRCRVGNWLGQKGEGRSSAFHFGNVPTSLGHRKVTARAAALGEGEA